MIRLSSMIRYQVINKVLGLRCFNDYTDWLFGMIVNRPRSKRPYVRILAYSCIFHHSNADVLESRLTTYILVILVRHSSFGHCGFCHGLSILHSPLSTFSLSLSLSLCCPLL